jgi:cytochrome c oxidase assembly protein subunit 15
VPSLRPRLWFIFGLGALQGAVGWWMVASGLADRVEVSQYRLATHLLLACLIYVALIFTAQRMDERAAPVAALPGRIRAGAIVLVVLVLAQIYLGGLVAGLRAGYAYNTWPLIDGALVPDAARLFFDTPLWRNFFENILTVQFDHRMLAYAIFVIALLHVIDVAGAVTDRGVRTGAFVLFAAILLQMALGIAALLWVVPLSLALLHQAMAMLVLIAATVHAAFLKHQRGNLPLIPAQAGIQPGSPLTRGRAG